jgi:hypothetical protein
VEPVELDTRPFGNTTRGDVVYVPDNREPVPIARIDYMDSSNLPEKINSSYSK